MTEKAIREFTVEVENMIKDAKNVWGAARNVAVEITHEAAREVREIGKTVMGSGRQMDVKVSLRIGGHIETKLCSSFKDPAGNLRTWTDEVRRSRSVKYF